MTERTARLFNEWLQKAEGFSQALREMTEEETEDAFYKDIDFGTGGLRGLMGAGTNRLNLYTVAKASQGLAEYVKKNSAENRSVAVGYDNRLNSYEFAKVACEVFAANGIKAYLYPQLMPTPCLAYAVRKLKCFAGVVITASHNPAEYNGYKVYNQDGCQITTRTAGEIFDEIVKIDIFKDVKRKAFETAVNDGSVEFIADSVYDSFIAEVKAHSVFGGNANSRLKIVYTPLNGTGLKPVLRALAESGFTDVTVVKEQEAPDGNFPTCRYPNPEIEQAMQLGLEYARNNGADLLLATDPDCDRLGVAVKDGKGGYRLLSGNETGFLLLDFICAARMKKQDIPKEAVMYKTIVTSSLGDKIAESYGVKTVNVLTGFKFIGEQIGLLEKDGKLENFIFAFEESLGYLTGAYVRDKDAVGAALSVCDMAAYYKTQGITLYDKLNLLYEKHGRYVSTLETQKFDGAKGFDEMREIMDNYRRAEEIDGRKIKEKVDYLQGVDGLPKSNVIKIVFEDGSSMVVRPSGTEPKLKIYRSFKRG